MEKKEFTIITEKHIDYTLENRERKTTTHTDIVLNEIENFIAGLLSPDKTLTLMHNGCEIAEYEFDDCFDDMEYKDTLLNLYRSFICYFAEYVNECNFSFEFEVAISYNNITESLRII